MAIKDFNYDKSKQIYKVTSLLMN
jgi:hypothetical protein